MVGNSAYIPHDLKEDVPARPDHQTHSCRSGLMHMHYSDGAPRAHLLHTQSHRQSARERYRPETVVGADSK